MAQHIRGERGGDLVLYNGFIYKKKKGKGQKDYYQCNDNGCLVTLHTLRNTLTVVQNAGVHTHNPPSDIVASTTVFEEAKRRIDADPTRHLPRLWEEVLNWYDLQYQDGWILPDFNEYRSSLYRHRSESLPPLPNSIHDIDFGAVNPTWSSTSRGTQFMLKHDTNWGITIFSSLEQLQILAASRFLLADGTFKSAPPPYAQLYTLHGIQNNRRIPLVFALMTNKATGDYVRLLQLVRRYVRRATGRPFDPELIVTDYELGMINAVGMELPNTTHVGCFFHFCQAIFKKVKEYGLVRAYRDQPRVQGFIRKIMALPFLPVLVLRVNYNLHKQQNRRLIRRYPALARLTLYFAMTWLNGSFPLPMWNVYNRHFRLRTTNGVEGWHKRWNGIVARTHPNIWYFIMSMKSEEIVIHRAIRKIRAHRPPPPQIRRYRMLNNMISQYKTEYEHNVKTLDEYWDHVQYACHQF